MSGSIDNRIVKMTFDNEKFQQGVAKTMETLDKLKEKLAFKDFDKSFKGIDISPKDMKFDAMASGVESLQKRFSTLGIIGMEVTRRLTNAAIDAGKRISSATIGQIRTGGMTRALNIEQARFQLKGLGLDVENVMKSANEAVDGTAYGLDEAAKAAAVLGSSGVKAGQQMTDVLTSISGAAAMTGRSYSDIADIYATVAGNGKLMTMQLRQFSASGLNVSAVLAKEFGKTEAEINEMVRKGQISFKQFSDAMSSFGEHAKSANDTYAGSLSNMKAALNRIGALFASPYLENARYVFHSITAALNEAKKALEPFAKEVEGAMVVVRNFVTKGFDVLTGKALDDGTYKFGAIADLVQGLVNIFKMLVSAVLPVGKAFREVFSGATFNNLAKILGRFKDFTAALKLNERQANNMKWLYKGIFSVLKLIGTVVGTVIKGLGKIFKPFGGLLNILNFIVGAIGRLVYAFATVITKVRIVSRAFSLVTTVIGGVLSGIVWLVKGIANVIKTIATSKPVVAVVDAISTAFKACVGFVSAFIDRIAELGRKIGKFIGNAAVSAFSKFAQLLTKGIAKGVEVIGKMVSKVKELFEVFKQSKAFSIFTGYVQTASEYIGKFIDKIKDLTRAIVDWVKEHSVAKAFIDTLATGLKVIVGVIVIVASKFKEFAEKAYEFFKETGLIEKFTEIFHKGFEKAKDALELVIDKIKTFGDFIKDKLKKPMDEVGDSAGQVGGKLKNGFEFIGLDKGVKVFSDALGTLKNILSALAGGLKYLWDNIIKNVLTNLVDLTRQKLQEFIGLFEGLKIKDILDYFPYEAFGVFLLALSGFVRKAKKSVGAFGDLAGSISGYFDALTDKLKGGDKWQQRARLLLVFAAAIFILAKAIQTLGNMDMKSLGKGVGAVAVSMGLMVGSLIILGKVTDKLETFDMNSTGRGLLLIASSMLVMAKAVEKFAGMDVMDMVKGFAGVAASLLVLSMAVKYGLGDAKNMASTGAGLLLISGALLALSVVIKIYSAFKWDTFGKGLLLVAGGLFVLAGAVRLMGKPSGILGAAAGMILMSTALIVMAAAVALFGKMKWETIAKGLLSVVVLMGTMTAAVILMNNANIGAVSKGIMRISIALAILAGSVKLLGSVDMPHLVASLVGFAAILGVMAVALYALSGKTDLIKTASSIVLVSAALALIAAAIKPLGDIPFENLVASLVGLTVLLAGMAIALGVLGSTNSNTLKVAGSMVVMSAAIVILAGALSVLAQIPADQIKTALLGLGGALLIIVAAGFIAGLGPVTVGLLALSAAFIALGVAALMIGGGLTMVAEGLTLLATIGPEAMTSVVEAMTTFIKELAGKAPEITVAAITIGSAFITGLIALIPQIAAAGVKMIVGLLAGIAQNIDQIALYAGRIIVEFILGIAKMIGPIINAGIMLMLSFIIGLAEGIRGNADLFFGALKMLLASMINLVIAALKSIVEMIPVVGDKISAGLDKVQGKVDEALDVTETTEKYKAKMDEISNSTKELAPDIEASGGLIKNAFGNAIDGTSEMMTGEAQEGTDGYIDAILGGQEGAFNAGSLLDQSTIDGIANGTVKPEDLMNSMMDGYNGSIISGGEKAKGAAKSVDEQTAAEFGKNSGKAKGGGEKQAESYASGISPKKVLASIKQIMSSVSTAFADKAAVGQVKSAGSKTVETFAAGITSRKQAADKAGKQMAGNAASGAGNSEAKRSANTAGINLGQGYVQGIAAKEQAAYDAGYALGKKGAQGVKDGEKAKSPSKLAIQAGEYLGQGLVIGINSMATAAYNAGYNLGDKTSKALTVAMSKVYDVLDADLDMNPTITPVLDLSNIQNGTNRLDSMFGLRPLNYALAGVGAIDASMGSRKLDSKSTTTTNSIYNTFNITVDGTESPVDFANELVNQIEMQTRMS